MEMQQPLTVITYDQDWAQLQILQFFTSATNDTKIAIFAVLVILIILVKFPVRLSTFNQNLNKFGKYDMNITPNSQKKLNDNCKFYKDCGQGSFKLQTNFKMKFSTSV